MIIGKYNKSVLLTYLGAAVSVMGMFLAMRGLLSYAMICLVAAGVCDLFDGVIARKCKRDEEEKAFGAQIDSLADMISFLAFPAVLGFALTGGAGEGQWSHASQGVASALWCQALRVAVFACYVLCGIIRLAWFHLLETASPAGSRERKAAYYQGLPVTYAALILPVWYLMEDFVPGEWFGRLTLLVYGVIAFCFIWKVKIKKPVGIWYGIFGALALAVTGLLIAKGV